MRVCVAVYEVTNSDAEAILRRAIQDPADRRVVRLRGLPFACTEAEIVHFFSGKTASKLLVKTLGARHDTAELCVLLHWFTHPQQLLLSS